MKNGAVSDADAELKKEKKRKHQKEDKDEKDAARDSSKKRKHARESDAGIENGVSPSKSDKKKEKKMKKEKKKEKKEEKGEKGEKEVKSKHRETERDAQSKPEKKKPASSASSASPAAPASSSPYHLITSTLYVPLSPISISPTHALSSLLSEHLSPLLLTYYPPFRGVVLAYSNPSISSTLPTSADAANASNGNANPQPLTLVASAGEYGVLYVYLTATFLVYRPERGQIHEACINVQSEGFLGAVALNLFSVGVERRRLPRDWQWEVSGDEGGNNSDAATDNEDAHAQKTENPSSSDNTLGLIGHDQDTASLEDDAATAMGFFKTGSGQRVRGTIRFRIRDVDVIPGSERDKGFVSIEGTMLSPEEDRKLDEDDLRRAGVSARLPLTRDEDISMVDA